MSRSFSITNRTKSTLPRVPFNKIKESALGKKYLLSLVFINKAQSKFLNKKYRGKNKPTNILSFNIAKECGEIFITPNIVKKQLKIFNLNYKKMTVYLFIHGIMHLKGMQHGSKMERAEEKLRRKFGV